MPNPGSVVTAVDGTQDFSGGVDSMKVTTVASAQNPNGLGRNQLSWLKNATVRDGGITPKWGYDLIKAAVASGLFQGAAEYTPDGADPYFVFAVGGDIFKIEPDGTTTNLSAANAGIHLSTTEPHFYFAQAEKWLVIQDGTVGKVGENLPLIWDGVTLRRSNGTANGVLTPGPTTNEIPAATVMCYYMGRLWYAQGGYFAAGDIVRGAAGTSTEDPPFRDAVLKVTENPLAAGGDGFRVPENGNIRALAYTAQIDTSLGQGPLYVFTRNAVYKFTVPEDRSAWILAGAGSTVSGATNPQLTVAQKANGAVSDRSIVVVNGDLFYQSLEPSIRSLVAAIKYYGQWGNRPISANERRILAFNDRALLHMSSGIFFDNRVLMSALPLQTDQGVIHQAIIPLDTMPISSFSVDTIPNWEGMWEGLDTFQMVRGDFGGLERAFAFTRNKTTGYVDFWELSTTKRSNYNAMGEARTTMVIESPAWTWANKGWELALKKLTGAELWVDQIRGTVEFTLEYRPDSDACWHSWMSWTACAARSSAETLAYPVSTPIAYGPGAMRPWNMPEPKADDCNPFTKRPSNIGYQFQYRFTIKGWCRLRGVLLKAQLFEMAEYLNIPDAPTRTTGGNVILGENGQPVLGEGGEEIVGE